LEKDYRSQYDGFDPNSPQGTLFFTLYQNAYLDHSLRIASYVEDEVKKGSGATKRSKTSRFPGAV